MSRTLTAAVQSALAGVNVPWCALVELDFASGFVRLNNSDYPITWSGYTWEGVGAISSFESIRESGDLEAHKLGMRVTGIGTLPITGSPSEADPVLIARNEHYQGRTCNVWLAMLDTGYQVIETPSLVFSGRMNTLSIELGATASIAVIAESRLADWDRARIRRYNDADQRTEYAADRGMEYVEQLVEKQLIWGAAPAASTTVQFHSVSPAPGTGSWQR